MGRLGALRDVATCACAVGARSAVWCCSVSASYSPRCATAVFDREEGLLRSGSASSESAGEPRFRCSICARSWSPRVDGIYVAYVERRLGSTIHLDEARRSAPLLALAEAISEVAELRLVFDATTRVAASD